MLEALMRQAKKKEIIGRPQIITLHGQTAMIGLNRAQDYITGLEALEKDGKVTYQAKKEQVQLGHSLRVTPDMYTADSIRLRVTASETSLAGNVVEIPVIKSGELKQVKASTIQPVLYAGDKAAFNVQQVETTVDVPVGCSAVIRGVVGKTEPNSDATEVIWILTPTKSAATVKLQSTSSPVGTFWSPVGTLTPSTLQDEGGKLYHLEPVDRKKTGLIYCKAEPGVDLEAYVNRRVQLFGTFAYHKSVRSYFMKVSEVQTSNNANGEEKESK